MDKEKAASSLKLIAVFAVGFLLWKYALFALRSIMQGYAVDTMWMVALSRFALIGYLLPFLLWLFIEPQKVCGFTREIHAQPSKCHLYGMALGIMC